MLTTSTLKGVGLKGRGFNTRTRLSAAEVARFPLSLVGVLVLVLQLISLVFQTVHTFYWPLLGASRWTYLP